jgi:F0F1-type ATP synthase assembly protein I
VTTPSPADPPSQPTPLEKADSGHQRMEEARMWNVVSYLISGPVMLGGAGFGLDHLLGTSWLVAVGIVAGMALSLYLIWFRYGTD